MFYIAKTFIPSKYKRNRYYQMRPTEDKGGRDFPSFPHLSDSRNSAGHRSLTSLSPESFQFLLSRISHFCGPVTTYVFPSFPLLLFLLLPQISILITSILLLLFHIGYDQSRQPVTCFRSGWTKKSLI